MLKREDMVGVYRQLGEDVVGADGQVIESDNNRSSQIMYSADGYVGVVSTPAGRKKLVQQREAWSAFMLAVQRAAGLEYA